MDGPDLPEGLGMDRHCLVTINETTAFLVGQNLPTILNYILMGCLKSLSGTPLALVFSRILIDFYGHPLPPEAVFVVMCNPSMIKL
jgi:hypothetical protein